MKNIKNMAKDPAFLFYPGDYLRDTQCLSEGAQVAYDRIMCEHMRNICITQQQLKFFTKKLSELEVEELMMTLKSVNGGFQIEWVAESILKRKDYSESRRKNRSKKEDNISTTYDEHMENENENRNINDNKGIGGVGEKGFFEKSINDEGWQEVVMRTCNIHDPVAWITKFNDHSIATEEHYNLLSDWRRHCVNWIKREIEKLNKQKTNAKQPKSARSEMDKLRDWYESVNAPTTGSGGE